jgi:hypothetical protein
MRKKLEGLQDGLNHIQNLNRDLWNRLEQVQENIEVALANPGPIAEHHHQNIIRRLKKIIDDFEDSHPGITSKLGEMVDSLSRMGF